MNKTLSQSHPYHLVSLSPWPLITSLNLMIFLTGSNLWFHKLNPELLILGSLTLILSLFQWWRDISRESTFQGIHTKEVSKLLRLGMILFIISELFFFMSFFWTLFHMSLSPSIDIGSAWPPSMLIPLNPMNTPLLNTIILLSSGISITWAHFGILNKSFKESILALYFTLSLGLYFSYLQYIEYQESSFTMADSVYGSIFFLITGFHGIHVIIGTFFIMISFYRLMLNHFSPNHHFGFEASAWYWHFVDIIWLFVFISLY